MRRLWIGLLIILMFLVIGQRIATIAQDNRGHEVRFKWAFGALKAGDGGPQLVAIKRDTTLKTGDALKMLLELEETCYAYVIHQGPRGEIRVLFPYVLSDLDAGDSESKACYIPKGSGWFELDGQVGQETFHLLASVERLTTLEKLLTAYESAGSESRTVAAQEVLAEIQQLRRSHRRLKAPAERPAQIVGRIRGRDEPGSGNRPDIDTLAVEISAQRFYSRTFTIDHN